MSVQVSEVVSEREERIRMLRAELQGIEDNKLLKSVISLNRKERKLRLRVLLYLREIDRRRLYLELGFPSMFAFCTGQLGYSRSAAFRRMAAARCIGKYPEAGVMLQKGETSVSVLTMVSGVINRENRREILNRIRGRSYREAEEELARQRPVRRAPERIRTVFTLKEEKRTSESTPDVGSGEKSVDRSSWRRMADKRRDINTKVQKEYRLEFMVNEKMMEKINRAKSLLSTKYPKGINLELLFDELLDNYLEENDPERRTDNKTEDNKPEKNENNRTRHIPQKVRDKVYRRDGGKCTFTGRNGKRCGSRWNLQYDHIVPFGKGGDNSPDNLRLLCGRHNQLMAEREYGREHMSCCRGDDP